MSPPPRFRAALLRSLPGSLSELPDQLAALRRQVWRWRTVAAGAGLLAAGLALFVAVGLRPKQDVGRYLAVVQGGGALPALIVRVDTRTGTAQVRPVGAEAPAGRNLELWYVGAEGPKPLGLVGAGPSRVTLPQGTSPDGVIAVSVEPTGGSPTGQPTGPVVYTASSSPNEEGDAVRSAPPASSGHQDAVDDVDDAVRLHDVRDRHRDCVALHVSKVDLLAARRRRRAVHPRR